MVRYDNARLGADSGGCQYGARVLLNDILRNFAHTYELGCYNPRNVRGSSSSRSLHAEGRAIDVGVPWGFKAIGDDLAALCILHSEEIQVQEVVYYRRIWSSTRPYWHAYDGENPHTDHVHIGLNWDGALGHAQYFNKDLELLPVPIKKEEPPMKLNDVTALTAGRRGYYALQADGGVFCYDGAQYFGSIPQLKLKLRPGVNHAVDILPHPNGKGYWILTYDGGIFTFGKIPFMGSYRTLPEKWRVGARRFVGGSVVNGGKGYWIFANDKAIYRFPTALSN